MTHEYVIALGGRVQPGAARPTSEPATAIAWAADRVLAIGSDDVVRSISRGDSVFLDLGGCVVTALPRDLARAEALVSEWADESPGSDLGSLLIDAEMVAPDSILEPGSSADLAFWRIAAGGSGALATAAKPDLVAVLRAGHFTEGDDHRGPFLAPAGP